MLTPDEHRAIASLKRLGKRWPQTLGLFSASGSLLVVRPDTHPLVEVDRIEGIPNDGGDPELMQL